MKSIIDKIKTFEDAMKATGHPDVPKFEDVPEDMREYFKAQYKMSVIVEALNEGWEPDWKDEEQTKWVPWFYFSPSGLVFYGSGYNCSYADTAVTSRLCLKSDELAEYAGKQFTDIWKVIITR